MLEMDRRGFLKAIFAAGVAPAFIKADSLMKLVVPSEELFVEEKSLILPTSGNRLLTIDMITKEALKILEQNLSLTENMNNLYVNQIGRTINVRRPARYFV